MARRILFFAVCVLSLLMAVFSSDALAAAREGLALWAATALPALFPFFVCASFLQRMGALDFVPKRSRILKKLGLPPETPAMAAVCAVSGAPTGARLAACMEAEDRISRASGTRLAALFNLASPMFLCGALGAGILSSVRAAAPIALGQYGSCFIMLAVCSLLFPLPVPCRAVMESPRSPRDTQPSKAIADALSDGVNGMLRIGASIVFFMVLIRILEKIGLFSLTARLFAPMADMLGIDAQLPSAVIAAVFEMTGGCVRIASLSVSLRLKTALCAGAVSFGGLCMTIQSLSFYRLKPLRYLLIKAVQAVLAFLIAYFTAPQFLPETVSAFAPVSGAELRRNLSFGAAALCSALLGLAAAWLFSAVCKKRARKRLRTR